MQVSRRLRLSSLALLIGVLISVMAGAVVAKARSVVGFYPFLSVEDANAIAIVVVSHFSKVDSNAGGPRSIFLTVLEEEPATSVTKALDAVGIETKALPAKKIDANGSELVLVRQLVSWSPRSATVRVGFWAGTDIVERRYSVRKKDNTWQVTDWKSVSPL
jgi:hypothetical protein